jgi:hypothetical protein
VSWVSNVLVSVALEDRDTIEAFNHWLVSEAPRRYDTPAKGVGQLGDLVGDEAPAGAARNIQSAASGAAPSITPTSTLWSRSLPDCAGRCRLLLSCS